MLVKYLAISDLPSISIAIVLGKAAATGFSFSATSSVATGCPISLWTILLVCF